MTNIKTTADHGDDPTPREKVIELIFGELRTAAADGKGADAYGMAIALLDQIERRALGKVEGALIFCDPDMPVGFVSEDRDDAASIRGSIA